LLIIKKIKSTFDNNEHLRKFTEFGFWSIIALFVAYGTTYLMNSELSKTEMGMYAKYFNSLNLLFPLLSLSMYSGYLRFSSVYSFHTLNKFIMRNLLISFVLFILVVQVFFNTPLLLSFCFIILLKGRLSYLRSILNIKAYSYLNTAQKIMFLICVYVLLIYGNIANKPESIIFLLGLSYAIIWGVSELCIKTQRVDDLAENNVNIDAKGKKIVLKFCVLVMFTEIVNWVLAVSDQLIVEYYYGPDSLAPYAVSFRIVSIIGMVAGLFLTYYPTLYFRDLDKNIKSNILIFRKYFFVALFFVAAILSIFSTEIYTIFGASKYIGDGKYYYWLLVGEFLRISAAVLMTFRTYKLQQHYILITLITISLLNVVLNFIFIPTYGPVFAAYSTCAVYFVYFIVSVFLSYLPERKYFSSLQRNL
jgi:O-antigen/teichoic acid export membrane protein